MSPSGDFWRLLFQGYATANRRCTHGSAPRFAASDWAPISFPRPFAPGRPAPHLTRDGRRFDRLITATIVSTPLLMPFYFDYDQLLLAIPGVLFAIELLTSPAERNRDQLPVSMRPSFVIGLWSIWYAWLMINPDVASLTRFNAAVVLSAGLSLSMIARAVSATTEMLDLVERLRNPPPSAMAA